MSTFLLALIIFLGILNFLVFIHELGHFLMAKLFGIPVHKFAIGFGPNILSKKFKGTEYQLNWILFGGFVQLEGEEDSKSEVGFRNKGTLPKIFVLLGGIIMNVLVALIFFQINLIINNYNFIIPSFSDYEFHNAESQEEIFPVLITDVDPEGGSFGQIEVDEVIVGIDGERFKNFDEFRAQLDSVQNSTVEFELLSDPSDDLASDLSFYTKEIMVGEEDPETGAILDVSLVADTAGNRSVFILKYNRTVFASVSQAYDLSIYQFEIIGDILSDAFSEGDYEEASEVFVGPIGLGDRVNEVVELQVFDYLIFLTGLISLSLAIFNILPIPALDGGQVMIVVLEFVFRRKFPDDLVNKINMAGFIFLIAFSLLITLKDTIQFGIIDWIEETFSSAIGRG